MYVAPSVYFFILDKINVEIRTFFLFCTSELIWNIYLHCTLPNHWGLLSQENSTGFYFNKMVHKFVVIYIWMYVIWSEYTKQKIRMKYYQEDNGINMQKLLTIVFLKMTFIKN